MSESLARVRSTLPRSVTASARAACGPGRLSLEVAASWSDDGPGPPDPALADAEDVFVGLDGRLVYRNQGRNQLEGHAEPPRPSKSGDARTYRLELDASFFGLGGGRHEVAFGFLRRPPDPLAPPSALCSATFALDVPGGALLGPQRPAPQAVPGRLVRSLFLLTPDEFRVRGLDPAVVHAAGVNAVEVALFGNPADWFAGGVDDPGWRRQVLGVSLRQWEVGWRARLEAELEWCRAHRLLAVFTGDDLFRTPRERFWWSGCPWRDEALRKARDLLASHADVSACVMLADEMDLLFGPESADEGVDVDALHALWHGAPGAPPLCCPGQRPHSYEAPSRTDMACRYFDEGGVELSALAGDRVRTPAQRAAAFDRMARSLAGAPPRFPVACQLRAMGVNYRKLSPGDSYSPGHDEPFDLGTPAGCAALEAWLPVVLCRARVLRGYLFDGRVARSRRLAAAVPSSHDNVGIRPGDDRWDAFAAAFRSLAAREAVLCSRTPLAPSIQDLWVTGGVEGLRVAANCSTVARPNPHFGGGVLVTPQGEAACRGGDVPPGGVVLEG